MDGGVPAFDSKRWRRQFAVAHLKDLIRDRQNPQPGPDEVLAAMRAAPVAPLQGEPFGVGMSGFLQVDPTLFRVSRSRAGGPPPKGPPAPPSEISQSDSEALTKAVQDFLDSLPGDCECVLTKATYQSADLAGRPLWCQDFCCTTTGSSTPCNCSGFKSFPVCVRDHGPDTEPLSDGSGTTSNTDGDDSESYWVAFLVVAPNLKIRRNGTIPSWVIPMVGASVAVGTAWLWSLYGDSSEPHGSCDTEEATAGYPNCRDKMDEGTWFETPEAAVAYIKYLFDTQKVYATKSTSTETMCDGPDEPRHYDVMVVDAEGTHYESIVCCDCCSDEGEGRYVIRQVCRISYLA